MDLIWKKPGEEEPSDEAKKWVDKRVTVITEVADPVRWDSARIRRLEQAVEQHLRECIADLARPSPFLTMFTKKRYMYWSKPRPHEFGPADAKSVLRRVRRGRRVSPALLARAVKTLVDEAGYDSDW